ncbi:6942_t:CDS:2 [Dentiscutata heterogama]|uniref:6942_t:CDS:1 n=1 Tax=Dentiscutata heterogama TaxID=1316150 RepID=A0ACA9KMV1_9GLOM|nr:6942_t:CDS:2 [Dentiscutata heterogama]
MPKCDCPKCQPLGGKLLSWRTWRRHQKNNYSHHTFSKQTLSNSASSANKKPIRPNTQSNYSDKWKNKTDYVDNENAMDYFDEIEMNDFDENEMDNFDIALSESSSHTEMAENVTQLQECSKDNFDRSEHDQSEDGNSNQSEDCNSDQNEHDIEQDIEEETDVEDETDEVYNTIISSSPLLNVNYSDPCGIILEPSYNPRSFMITKTGIITLIIFFYQVLTYLDIFQFQNFPRSQHYVEKLIAQPTNESNEKLMYSPFKRQVEKGVLGDIYDGKVWKEFLDERGQPFFVGNSTVVRIGLAFNLDWYTPYSHVKRSCAPIYLTILNFPKHIRYQSENLILVGIIPGPEEPNTN